MVEIARDKKSTIYAVIPVFNRYQFTRECIKYLKSQTYHSLKIVVADGGSTDGSVEMIRSEFSDVVVLTSKKELWWTGAIALGIDYVINESANLDDCVLMINNDTLIPVDYVEKLHAAVKTYDAAVCGLIVDSKNEDHILDAGEYINWENYTFPVKNTIQVGEIFCDDVDVLPGRGSLIPLKMIRQAGSVDEKLLPHYLADYEFFYRLKKCGFKLGVTYQTKILAHIEETGIIPTAGVSRLGVIWKELFSRRSMSNVIDHWRFVGRHAPQEYKCNILWNLIKRVLVALTLRTQFRPLFLPIYWLICSPQRMISYIKHLHSLFKELLRLIDRYGVNVICFPQEFPRAIRSVIYLIASPGPLHINTLLSNGFEVKSLLETKILRQLQVNGWYILQRITNNNSQEAKVIRRLFWTSWNPLNKFKNTRAWCEAKSK